MRKLTFGELFAGIGGFGYGLEMTGSFEVAWQVEIDDYCNKVLAKHWPDVRRYRDVKEVHGVLAHAESINRRNERENIRNGSGWESGSIPSKNSLNGTKNCPSCLPPVDVICGGVPCQPASVAGKQRGEADDRWLWPEALRVVREVKPTWVIFENVVGMLALDGGMAFEKVLLEMESYHYEVQTYIIPACAVDAPHRRDRVWIVARIQDSERGRFLEREHGEQGNTRNEREFGTGDKERVCGEKKPREDVADADEQRGCLRNTGGFNAEDVGEPSGCERGRFWLPERGVGFGTHGLPTGLVRPGFWDGDWERGIPRVAKGVKDRVNKLRCLGNAVVPQLVEMIGRAILTAHNQREE